VFWSGGMVLVGAWGRRREMEGTWDTTALYLELHLMRDAYPCVDHVCMCV
jgi:hypothetical protein